MGLWGTGNTTSRPLPPHTHNFPMIPGFYRSNAVHRSTSCLGRNTVSRVLLPPGQGTATDTSCRCTSGRLSSVQVVHEWHGCGRYRCGVETIVAVGAPAESASGAEPVAQSISMPLRIRTRESSPDASQSPRAVPRLTPAPVQDPDPLPPPTPTPTPVPSSVPSPRPSGGVSEISHQFSGTT